MAQNSAPDTEDFCASLEVLTRSPAIRFIGGIAVEPQVDPNEGPPTACSLTMDMVGNLNATLAGFQPVLAILDLVATLGQFTKLLAECVTNPFKIPPLIALIPGLSTKINTVLQLVPIFPQGIQAFVTFCVDAIRFISTQLACLVSILRAIQTQIDAISELSRQLNGEEDESVRVSLQALIDCGQSEIDTQTTTVLGALGPVARLLCVIRGYIAMIPNGKEVQKLLRFPDPSQIVNLSDAIVALDLIQTILATAEEAIVALSLGLALPPPELTFVCPIDALADDIPLPPVEPVLETLLDSAGAPVASIAATAPDADSTVFMVTGTGFDERTKGYWGTAEIEVQFRNSQSLVLIVSAELTATPGQFQICVANEPESTGSLFSGLTGPSGETTPSEVKVSNQIPIEVT